MRLLRCGAGMMLVVAGCKGEGKAASELAPLRAVHVKLTTAAREGGASTSDVEPGPVRVADPELSCTLVVKEGEPGSRTVRCERGGNATTGIFHCAPTGPEVGALAGTLLVGNLDAHVAHSFVVECAYAP